MTPVFPGLADGKMTEWEGATGLAADVRAYGEWMRDEAFERIGEHYPNARLEDGSEATVIAWIWARTVTCPNPTCGIELPLVRSWWLAKKGGREAWVRPVVVTDDSHPSGKRVEFEISHNPVGPTTDGTMSGKKGATCVACGASVATDHVKAEGVAGRLGATLMAIVAEGVRRRVFLAPTERHAADSIVDKPSDVPDQELGHDPRNLWTPQYGLKRFSDLFTNRQLLALTTFSDLVKEARERVFADALAAGLLSGDRLEAGGDGAEAYADAVATYLGIGLSRATDYMSSSTSWHSGNEQIRTVFARQAIPMAWDFTETNPFGDGSGSWVSQVELASEVLDGVETGVGATASQSPAQTEIVRSKGFVISTDPPYYDNVGYSDLSDFFYVWLRRSLRDIHPSLLGTLLVPKAEELVANPYRHDGVNGAKAFFESGFRDVFAHARESALDDFPITVYYAYKQSGPGSDGATSTGWETLLEGMVGAGWRVSSTWPFRTETASRMIAQGTNALGSSIVLSLRPRSINAPTTDRRGFVTALKEELPDALRNLQHGAIAPVDLRQSAIGPGMAVFSRYSRVIEDDGSQMTVRSALARINEILDQVLSEQEGDFDPHTRFAISWYELHGYATGKFGDANNVAQGRNTSVDALKHAGIVKSAAGKAALIAPAELPEDYDALTDDSVSQWEVLHHLIAFLDKKLERGGVPAARQVHRPGSSSG